MTHPYSGVFFDDGLSLEAAKLRYAKRRQTFYKTLSMPFVTVGIQEDQGHPYVWHMNSTPTFQDPLFLYLTGINQPQAALFYDPKTKKESLFLPKKNARLEFWEGYHLGFDPDGGHENATNITGFISIYPIKTLLPFLKNHISQTNIQHVGSVWNSTVSGKIVSDNHGQFIKKARRYFSRYKKKVTFTSHMEKITEIRTCLDDCDINNMREANEHTASAIQAVIASLPQIDTETEAHGRLVGELLKRSSRGLSFTPIVAGGKNACTLHYNKNDDPLPKNGLLLIDCGCRAHSVAADITRTVPISGTFNPLQKLLYSIVLETQKYVESHVTAGVTLRHLNELCWAYMDRLLDTRFLSQGGVFRRDYDSAPHNVGHLIGHAVHDGDAQRSYQTLPLRIGQIITIEPGLYGHFEATLSDHAYAEFIGIRIEDNILITASGCENLSLSCPKDTFLT